MRTFHCRNTVGNKLKVQSKGGKILSGGTMFLTYVALYRIVHDEVVV